MFIFVYADYLYIHLSSLSGLRCNYAPASLQSFGFPIHQHHHQFPSLLGIDIPGDFHIPTLTLTN